MGEAKAIEIRVGIPPAPTPTAIPTSTPVPTVVTTQRKCPTSIENKNLPVYQAVTPEMVDLFRITTCEIWEIEGGSLHQLIELESDSLILARVAMGENPNSLNERTYIMWFIRLRAELGYKNAGTRGWEQPPDRWWYVPTTIKQEALCINGCQFQPVQLWAGIYFPASLETGQLTAMIYPRGEQLIDFLHTYEMAQWVLDQPISSYPQELRGYDEFRSSTIAGLGRYHREGGLKSRAMFNESSPYNIFRDVSPWDNVFWENIERNKNNDRSKE